jgi:hypothetical protein
LLKKEKELKIPLFVDCNSGFFSFFLQELKVEFFWIGKQKLWNCCADWHSSLLSCRSFKRYYKKRWEKALYSQLPLSLSSLYFTFLMLYTTNTQYTAWDESLLEGEEYKRKVLESLIKRNHKFKALGTDKSGLNDRK